MQEGRPSRTAWAAALHRAAHQVVEQGRIFRDPLALSILGDNAENLVREFADDPARRRMRIFIALRTRFTEDALSAAVESGVKQLVVLGAGLDTLAYRTPFGSQLRMFEVDHPATQAWKRERLRETGISIPPSLVYSPVNFETETLAEGLANAGFDESQPTFFSWLGVVPYLTENAIWLTLGFIAGLRGEAQVVFDYSNPPDQLSAEMKDWHDERAARVEREGEAWVTYFDSPSLHTKLSALGFSEIEDLSPRDMAERYFSNRAHTASDKGGHLCRAAREGGAG